MSRPAGRPTFPRTMTVNIDTELAERLVLIVEELGGRQLPLPVIVRALLLEAAERLEGDRRNRTSTD